MKLIVHRPQPSRLSLNWLLEKAEKTAEFCGNFTLAVMFLWSVYAAGVAVSFAIQVLFG